MPAKTKAQYNLMQAASHSAKGIGGLDKKTAKKFVKETPKKKRSLFSRGKD